MPLLCIVKEPWFHFIVPVIVPPLASKFEFYCASIVSSKRAFFEFIVPVIVPPLASKFKFYCASIVSSKKSLGLTLLCL